jgi:predicted membrane-bound mannosyltransferase
VLDPRRFASRDELLAFVRSRIAWARDRLRTGAASGVALHGAGAVLAFVLLVVFMYARRAPPGEGVGLWHSGPVTVLKYVVGDIACGLEFWSPVDDIPVPHVLVPGQLQGQTCPGFPEGEGGPLSDYGTYMGRQLQVVGKTAVTVAALSVVGVVAEFRRETPRVLVPAAFYWGVASLLGYPVGSDILYPAWVAMHAVVPLTIPAAAGAASLLDWTRDAVEAGDEVPAAALSLALLLMAGTTAGVAVHHSYVAPTGQTWSSGEAQMVQFAQPERAMGEAVTATRHASAANDGLDVLVYDGDSGEQYSLVDMGGPDEHAVGCMKFFYALPLSYYFYADEADVDCADNASALSTGLQRDPAVVVVREKSARDVRTLAGDEYATRSYNMRQGGRTVTFFFDPERVEVPPPNREEGSAASVR